METGPELHAETVAQQSLYAMFCNCQSFIDGPSVIPIRQFTGYMSCMSMFQDCTSLTTAPQLPATTLYGGCYQNMFQGCTSLERAPELPATELDSSWWSVYGGMFSGCTSLNYAKVMAINFSNMGQYSNMLNGVAQSGTFVKNVNAEWTESDVIPSGWTVETASS